MTLGNIDQLALLAYGAYVSSMILGVMLMLEHQRRGRVSGLVMLLAGGLATTVITWMSSRFWGRSGSDLIALRLADLSRYVLQITLPLLVGLIYFLVVLFVVRKFLAKGNVLAGGLIPVAAVIVLFIPTTLTLIEWSDEIRPVAVDPGGGGLQIQAGFKIELLPVTGIANPTSLEFNDNGDLFISTYGGLIWIIPSEAGQLRYPRAQVFDQGYKVPVGLAWHAGTLYVSSHGKVTAVRDTDGDSVADVTRDIVSGLPARLYPWHANNDLVYGPDGRLYMAVGSTTDASVETREYAASILAIDPETGDIEVFATGVRNPFDLAFNEHGDLFATDNGPDSLESTPGDELNHIIEGQDYGFPMYFEYPPPGVHSQPPVVVFPPHASADGLIFYLGDEFPSMYYGNAFVALFNRGEIDRIELMEDENGRYLARTEVFSSGFLGPLDLAVGARWSFVFD